MSGFNDLVPEAMPYLASELIQATAGASWEWSYTLVDSAGTPIPWSGVTATAVIYSAPENGSLILSLTTSLPSDGTLTVTATPTQTEAIAADTYWYEVELVNGAGRKVKVVGAGDSRIKVKGEVAP